MAKEGTVADGENPEDLGAARRYLEEARSEMVGLESTVDVERMEQCWEVVLTCQHTFYFLIAWEMIQNCRCRAHSRITIPFTWRRTLNPCISASTPEALTQRLCRQLLERDF